MHPHAATSGDTARTSLHATFEAEHAAAAASHLVAAAQQALGLLLDAGAAARAGADAQAPEGFHTARRHRGRLTRSRSGSLQLRCSAHGRVVACLLLGLALQRPGGQGQGPAGAAAGHRAALRGLAQLCRAQQVPRHAGPVEGCPASVAAHHQTNGGGARAGGHGKVAQVFVTQANRAFAQVPGKATCGHVLHGTCEPGVEIGNVSSDVKAAAAQDKFHRRSAH
mmetsp:Transcript_74813/g.242921  ORF Transcript_74813/g.242921 Transcript_74813/m.242921 type:complete len:224 (-) Transcript_74813:1777-2448(-)